MNRRTFIRATGATAVAFGPSSSLLALEADNAYRKNIGIQLYTLRDAIAKDPVAALKQVADDGYKQVELYGFPNSDAMISAAKDAGLAIHSSHFEWDSVVNPKDAAMSDFAKILEKAEEIGLTHLVIPYLQEGNRKTLDDYKQVAAHSNQAAAMAKKAGIQLSYHNHSFEFEPKEGGKCGYDILREEFSPEMKFEIDVFWVKVADLDPAALIKEMTGRVTQLHLKDLKEGIKLPIYSGVPNDAFKELGNGIIDIEPIIVVAKAAGVEYCHVEQDQSPDPLASIQESIQYLNKL
ncbi:sugar phosphate isomerase/epimerase family protein [Haloferula sp.]|uniref:sugar phosphate isomerase/epimerase family protein n=1 Tax=Haloferula sp. TaxID=2497595 RepID=UPI003C776E9A